MGSFIWIYIIIVVVVFVILFLLVMLGRNKNNKKSIDYAVSIFLFGFMIFALSVTAIYSSIASADTGGKNLDARNNTAHTYYTWATVFAWIGVGVAVLGTVALLWWIYTNPAARAAASASGTGGGLVNFCLGVIVALMAFVGLMSAIGAGYQGGSTSKKGYRAGIIAAVTSIIIAVLVFALVISKKWKEKHDKNQKLKQLTEEKSMLNVEKNNLIEMKELKEQREQIGQIGQIGQIEKAEVPVKSKSA